MDKARKTKSPALFQNRALFLIVFNYLAEAKRLATSFQFTTLKNALM